MNEYLNKEDEITISIVGILMVSMLFLIIIHELLHAAVLMMFCEKKYKSIKIGFKKEYMTPYCHCKEWLYGWQYVLGLLAPFIFLGIIPCIASFIINNFTLFLISQFGIVAAGGDIIISMLISLKIPLKSLVKDHPEIVGCIYKPIIRGEK